MNLHNNLYDLRKKMTKLYEANNHILIHTGYDNPVMHRHMAAHIIISINGKMCVESDGVEYQCHGVMLPSGTLHSVNTYGKPALVFLYDCTTDIAKQIQTISYVSGDCCQKIVESYTNFENACTSDDYRRFERYVLAQLGFASMSACVRDERILSAMEYIRSMASENLSCKTVADTVCLSQSRFSHLFKEQVGMTFAAYLIYQRIMCVYALLLQGKAITEAALEAGFSSSAHFADVNRRIFGLPASTITCDLVFVKVH